MKKNTIFILMLSFLNLTITLIIPSSLKCQNFVWAKEIGGTDYEHARTIATDAMGNVYTAGAFYGMPDLDPGSGIITATCDPTYGEPDMYLLKQDPSGNLLWVKTWGLKRHDEIKAMVISNSGDIYLTGAYNGQSLGLDFDPGTSTHIAHSVGYSDIFILKLDGMGNFKWVKTVGSSDQDIGTAITLDNLGNVIVAGSFQGTADFNPGSGVFNMTTSYSSSVYYNDDVFILKLDSLGNFIWAKSFDGLNTDVSSSIVADKYGDIYTCGFFGGTIDFNPGAGVYNLTSTPNGKNFFVSKLNSAGNFVNAFILGGPYSFWTLHYPKMSVDQNANLYICGFFDSLGDFDPGSGLVALNPVGNGDIFTAKFNPSGNLIWVKQFGGIGDDYGKSLVLDSENNVYTTGFFENTVDFDPGSGVFNLISGTVSSAFITKQDSMGNWLWTKQIAGTSFVYGNAITIDNMRNIYVTGGFVGTADFDPNAGIYNVVSSGGSNPNVFILKLNEPVISSTTEFSNSTGVIIYPNPTNESISVQTTFTQKEAATLNIYSVSGTLLKASLLTEAKTTINISELPTGMYFVEVIGVHTREIQKVVKQ